MVEFGRRGSRATIRVAPSRRPGAGRGEGRREADSNLPGTLRGDELHVSIVFEQDVFGLDGPWSSTCSRAAPAGGETSDPDDLLRPGVDCTLWAAAGSVLMGREEEDAGHVPRSAPIVDIDCAGLNGWRGRRVAPRRLDSWSAGLVDESSRTLVDDQEGQERERPSGRRSARRSRRETVTVDVDPMDEPADEAAGKAEGQEDGDRRQRAQR